MKEEKPMNIMDDRYLYSVLKKIVVRILTFVFLLSGGLYAIGVATDDREEVKRYSIYDETRPEKRIIDEALSGYGGEAGYYEGTQSAGSGYGGGVNPYYYESGVTLQAGDSSVRLDMTPDEIWEIWEQISYDLDFQDFCEYYGY